MTAQRPFRLLVVIQTPKDPQSAVYIAYQSLASALEARRHSVQIVAPSDFGNVSRFGGRWVPLTYPVAVAGWLRRRSADFDGILFHSYAGWLATARGLRQAKSVVMFHGVEPLYHGELRKESLADRRRLSWRYRFLQEQLMPLMLRTACRGSDVVTCLNRAEAAYLASRRWAPADRIRILAHGVPPQFFEVRRSARPIRTLLFVGQWLPMKGVRYLRKAAVTLLRDMPELRLVCAGTLSDPNVVLDGFPGALRPRVIVVPRVNQTELARLYEDADVFVFPSLYEGFSRAIVEAMASQLPIVSTAVGVALDSLRTDVNALLIPKRDADAIVSSVQRLCADPALAARLAREARETANDYMLDSVIHRTIDVIEAAVGTR